MQRVPVNQKKLHWSFSLQLFKMHHVFQSKSGVNHVLTLTGKELSFQEQKQREEIQFLKQQVQAMEIVKNLKNTNVESTHLKKKTLISVMNLALHNRNYTR